MTIKTDHASKGGTPADAELAGLLENRCEQLHKLAREHLECLSFAAEIAQIAENGGDAALARGVEKVREYNDRELEAHLQHEEQTIFAPLIQQHRQHMELCIALAREHGVMRTLVEEMSPETGRRDLADFAVLLTQHTLREEKELFPHLESLFTAEQWDKLADFTPLGRATTPPPQPAAPEIESQGADGEWLSSVESMLNRDRAKKGKIVLFPRYQPDLFQKLSEHLETAFFDYQQEVMEGLGLAAESVTLDELTSRLQSEAARSGILSHNVEALLCVKSPSERRAWLQSFLDADWPNPVVLPITVFQADVPQGHPGVCELALQMMPGR